MDRTTAGPADHVAVRPRPGGIRFGHQSKLAALYAWAARRPLAVLDDEFGGKDPATADQRTADGAPILLRPVDPNRRADVDTVLTWLSRL
jgi:hypothetical protein